MWKSDVVARVNGCSFGATGEQHERIAYSSPLVHGDRVYVGIHDAGDDPIQNGKLIALDADTGRIRPAFNFEATSVRGGGIWNAPAAERDDVLFTTGNTSDGVVSEPVPNHGLSMISVEARSGAINWQFQPVPFALDDDPDWAAGVALARTSCGRIAASVMKDGWAYALDANNGECRWQFPATVPPADHCRFPASGAHVHGDTDYKRPAVIWQNTLAVVTGGEALVAAGGVSNGYGRLHGLTSAPRRRAIAFAGSATCPITEAAATHSAHLPRPTGSSISPLTKGMLSQSRIQPSRRRPAFDARRLHDSSELRGLRFLTLCGGAPPTSR